MLTICYINGEFQKRNGKKEANGNSNGDQYNNEMKKLSRWA